MSIVLHDLYQELAERFGVRLLAGKSGLQHEVTWPYLLEDINNTQLLRGHELIITTGMSLSSAAWLSQLIEQLHAKQAAALLLNTGKYIREEDITPALIELCDSLELPLFTVPWHVHLADIMQEGFARIFHSGVESDDLTGYFRNALFYPAQTEQYLPALLEHGFHEEARYQAIVMLFPASPDTDGQPLELLTVQIKSTLNYYSTSYHLFKDQQHLLLLLHQTSDDAVAQCIQALDAMRRTDIPSDFYIAAGRAVQRLSQLHLSYRQALEALRDGRAHKRFLTMFQALGVTQLLYGIEDLELLRAYCLDLIGPLTSYDARHHTNLSTVLWHYLRFDCSIQQVAQEMYTHRNTINYRIQKIKSILQTDLKDPQWRFECLLAFKAWHYLQERK
ncbi:MAG: PucR family transcriptional regulator [Lachnospiraceae bacterium]